MPKRTRDPGPLFFTATIEQTDASGATGFIVFPYDLKETYGIGNLVPVVATFDGFEYRDSIAKMGPQPLLLIRKDVRAKLGKAAGATVEVTVALDKSEREVEIPEDLKAALSENPEAQASFKKPSYSHQRNYVHWINQGRRSKTRQSRIEKAVRMLAEGKRLK